MVLSLGTQPRASVRAMTDPPTLLGAHRDLQPFLPADPAHALAVDLPRLAPQLLRQPAIAITRMKPGQSENPRPQPPVSLSLGPCRVALRRSGLIHEPAGSSLRVLRGLDDTASTETSTLSLHDALSRS